MVEGKGTGAAALVLLPSPLPPAVPGAALGWGWPRVPALLDLTATGLEVSLAQRSLKPCRSPYIKLKQADLFSKIPFI